MLTTKARSSSFYNETQCFCRRSYLQCFTLIFSCFSSHSLIFMCLFIKERKKKKRTRTVTELQLHATFFLLDCYTNSNTRKSRLPVKRFISDSRVINVFIFKTTTAQKRRSLLFFLWIELKPHKDEHNGPHGFCTVFSRLPERGQLAEH